MTATFIMKNIVSGVNILLTAIFITAAVCLAYVAFPAFGNKALIVRSGSMEPKISVGDLVVVKGQSGITYKAGDIIAFKANTNSKMIVTHRVSGVEQKGSEIFYKTKGDANDSDDKELVSQRNILGEAQFRVPQVGRLFAFAKSNLEFPLLVIFPAFMVIILELVNIYKEIKKQKKSQGREQQLGEKTLINIYGLRVIIPLVISIMFFQNSFAFFSDTETSNNNNFFASESFGPSIANHLVINEVMFDPPNTNACGAENDAEWVEIYNPTASPVNLDTWLVGDGNFTDDLPNVSLPAGGFAVVSDCAQSSFTSIWSLPSGTVYIDLSSAIGNGLNNGGEHMRLFDGASLIDNMSYGSNTAAFSPSVLAPVADHSIERDPDGVDTNTAADFVDRTTPTPGS